MTDALDEAIEAATQDVTAISDPVASFRATREVRAQLNAGDRRLIEHEKRMVWLLREGRTWEEVGEMLGFSGSRAEAIARGR
ncbi:hypothetical protein SMD44_00954 [Streptomyces alboflavus]|uniref:Uncharacterized protein n=1 Tax=Streptomyces alboflavus TaxID=67267 RepID=A0A1Z1W552_9ACTN|nr:hypothetical protein [Streptomyces alboflavus]ARX81556.1 hypothetical protein SMD44_00954 [Streptomyces alboflavus]